MNRRGVSGGVGGRGRKKEAGGSKGGDNAGDAEVGGDKEGRKTNAKKSRGGGRRDREYRGYRQWQGKAPGDRGGGRFRTHGLVTASLCLPLRRPPGVVSPCW